MGPDLRFVQLPVVQNCEMEVSQAAQGQDMSGAHFYQNIGVFEDARLGHLSSSSSGGSSSSSSGGSSASSDWRLARKQQQQLQQPSPSQPPPYKFFESQSVALGGKLPGGVCSSSSSSSSSSKPVGRTVGVCRPIMAACAPEPCPAEAAACHTVDHRPTVQVAPLVVQLPPPQGMAASAGQSDYDNPRSCRVLMANPGRAAEDSGAVSQYSQASQLSRAELEIILKTYKHLDQCNYFYKDISMHGAKKKLSKQETGTFLLRESSDPNYILSLSVKTDRGTTSVRIAYRDHKFSLDSDPSLQAELPSFTSVFELVEHYIKLSSAFKKNNMVFLEATGRKDTPIVLKKPCLPAPSSLKHLSRLAINSALRSQTNKLHGLPGASTSIIDYLIEYPYTL